MSLYTVLAVVGHAKFRRWLEGWFYCRDFNLLESLFVCMWCGICDGGGL